MPITEDRLSRLREFGLSEYAARAYLALLDLGVAEARDVSTLSKVPTSKIYHVLDQLHERGLVEILPEFPKRFAPISFGEFLDKVLVDHRSRVTTLERERDALVRMFSVTGDVDLGERGSFMLLRGRRNVLNEFRGLLAGAEGDVLIYGGVGAGLRAALHALEAEAALGRGVTLRLLVPDDPAVTEALSRFGSPFQVRHRDSPGGVEGPGITIAVADGRRAVIAHFIPDDASTTRGDDTAIATDDKGMIAALRTVLEDTWRFAETSRRPSPEGDAPPSVEAFWARVRGHALLAVPVTALSSWVAAPGLPEAVARGARIRLVTDDPARAGALLPPEVAAAVEVRGVPRLHLHAAVADASEGLLVLPRPPGTAAAEAVVRVREAVQLAPLAAAFESLWAAAQPLAAPSPGSPAAPIF
ncbi:MAG TPA: helix-turn-helix domain-containing protein [Candidatus Thermoplasmatota archaeon]|nr:helix-turn-helix domain-containing protein [Candidatus Thermoplasmatota archaeon]